MGACLVLLVTLALIICPPAPPRWGPLGTVGCTGCLKKKIHVVVSFFQCHILLCLWLGVLFLSPVCAWGCLNYDWLLRVKLCDVTWANLEVQWCLQGSLTLSLSVPFPFCFTYNSLLCNPDLSVELCASYDLAPSQSKLAQLVENQSRKKKHFFSAVLVSWLFF